MTPSVEPSQGAGGTVTRNDEIVCGFIGLGSQGAPIAHRMLDAGFPTVLWARRPESLDPFRAKGARLATSIGELGGIAQHVGICVVNDDDVRQVCAELVPAMRHGSWIAIHSTIHPKTCAWVEHLAAGYGVGVIDAPVSGGSPAAEAGTLTLMLGGDPGTIAAATPVFQSFGRLIVRLGGVGTGQQAKLINNTLLAANIGLADRAFQAGESLGIEAQALLALLRESSGQSFGLGVRGRMTRPTDFSHGASLLKKDVDLLGQVLGAEHPAFVALQGACGTFLKQALGASSGA